MRKLFLAFATILSIVFIFPSPALANQNGFQINDQEALQAYNEALQCNKTKYTRTDDKFYNLKQLDISDDDDLEILYNKNSETESITVANDKSTNTVILLDANYDSDDLTMFINGSEYLLRTEGEDLIAYESNGSSFPLIKTTYITAPEENLQLNDKSELLSRSSWTKNYGPFYKTNKTYVKLLEKIADAAGKINKYVVKHKIIGVITVSIKYVSHVYNKYALTLYIKYYIAYEKGNYTHVRETDKFYLNSNYTNFVKNRVHYYYSSRPINGMSHTRIGALNS